MKIKKIIRKIKHSPLVHNFIFMLILISLFVFFTIEFFEYMSVFKVFNFLLQNPIAFFTNYLLVLTTFSIVGLFRRRFFLFAIIALPWLAIGITNGIILQFRLTPFTTADLSLIGMGIDILPNYFNTIQLILIALIILVVILFFIFLFIFAPKLKGKINYKRNIFIFLVIILLTTSLYNISLKSGAISTKFKNLWDAYADYGVPYSFLNTWLNKGIKKPSDYSKESIINIFGKEKLDKILEEYETKKKQKESPNIIFLQLESFIDPTLIKGLKFSKTPVPFFKELKQKYTSGELTVPVMGGGTANTEFEVQTGFSVNFFGPGEYPYKTILSKETVPTMAYDMKNIGYKTHVMHNHRGMFYNRNTVFPNMGYDDFTSLEYMLNIEKSERNWTRDIVLSSEIEDILKSTKEMDYIYTISVQGHGEYAKNKVVENPYVRVSGFKDKDMKNAYEYYVHQLMDMDNFVKDLTKRLEKLDEKTVLVLYGDHQPALDLEDEDLELGSLLKTEYVVWANYDLEKQDKNLYTYELSAYVQKLLGMKEGIITNFHDIYDYKGNYLSKLQALQYDLLYGNKYVEEGRDLYKKTDMAMGFREIKIDEIVTIGKKKYIKGSGFTIYSKITLNDKELETKFLSENILRLDDDVDEEDVGELKISQIEKNNNILSTTE
ncbi:MAG: sulfatase-like hydrolase/transferase [Clostridiales Family XIII bacterium]|jgi:phosphoglycerol transferase MdoB-like AlkP superfamily enzyme|nr:sulfatase-like hydrolase/transferase [Clostridiales Family XIII bacterium]